MRWPGGRRRSELPATSAPVAVTVEPGADPAVTVTVSPGFDAYVPEWIDTSPLGLAVVPVSEVLEVVVFASVRRRQEVRS